MTEAAQIEDRTRHSNGYASRALAATVMTSLAVASGGVQSTEATPARSASLRECATYFDPAAYPNHEYEVCAAYLGNSAGVALQGLYKFGNNRIGYIADPARHHFETRYWGEPRQSIERDVDSWPRTSRVTGNKVKKSIDIVSVSSNVKADRGLVRTRESWDVTAPRGKTLHHEPRHTKDITMCRGKLPGHILHAWFVVNFAPEPNFDCIAFDKHHGITP